jgi:integrase
MATTITETTAKTLEVPEGKRDAVVFDDVQPGLFLRKFATGKAVYGCKYYVNGGERKVVLREAPINVTAKVAKQVLTSARKEAGDLRAKARLGTDVVKQREDAKAAKATEAKLAEKTLGKIVDLYLKDREPDMRPLYFKEVKRHLEKDFAPLAKRPLHSITKQDIDEVLDGLKTKTAADHAQSALSTFYVWGIDKHHVTGTPLAHAKRRAEPVKRQRYLKLDELREVLLACDAVDEDGNRLVPADYAKIVRLLALTGQRRDEIGDLIWPEVIEGGEHGDHIRLPETRTKNWLPHMIPLVPQAKGLLPAKRDGWDMLFGRRQASGYSGWSKSKKELDAAILAVRRSADPKARPMDHWTVHDLRRTFSTHLNELKALNPHTRKLEKVADPHLVELILNHQSGTKNSVAGTYDCSVRMDDRRVALQAWADRIDALMK